MAQVTLGVIAILEGFDMSCFLKTLEPKGEQAMVEATTLCSTGAKDFAAGLVERGVTGDGFFHYNIADDTKSLDKYFNDNFAAGDNNLVALGVGGFSVGAPAILMNAKQMSYKIGAEVGQILPFSFEMKTSKDGATREYANGRWLMYQTVTGTVNGTSLDKTGATTGYYAQAHLTDSNLTSVTVKIQHSTDNSSWADLVTFTAFTANGAQQAVNTATSVNRYVRAIVSAFSGTTGKIAVAIGTPYV